MSLMLTVFLIQPATAQEAEKYKDKQIEELSKKAFRYSNIDGKQSLTLIPKLEPDWWEKAAPNPCDNNVALLKSRAEAISIPGTSLILAFLDCPAWSDWENDSIVAFFDRDNLEAPFCFSRVVLMDKPDGQTRLYYYGNIMSLEAREASDDALYVVAKLSGGDGGDIWVSLAFLHIDMNCETTVLSKLYTDYSVRWNADEEGGGERMVYRFIDNKTVEVTTLQIAFADRKVQRIVKMTQKKYDLAELYNNPKSRVFPISSPMLTPRAVPQSGTDSRNDFVPF